MKVIIGSDHAGYLMKEELERVLGEWRHEVEDVGAHSTESTDYPDFAERLAERVLAEPGALGVLVCGTGIGISIAANKIPGIRAARCDEPFSARKAREHNDANVLCMGERVIGVGVAVETMRAFLETPFAGGRHQRRVDKIGELERKALLRRE